jgi:hypothetical protein
MKRLLMLIGIVLIAAAGIWKFGLSSQWTQRFPSNWRWEMNFIGTTLYPDATTGKYAADRAFPEGDDINISERVITVGTDKSAFGGVVMDDHYTSKDVNTGTVTWDYVYKADVDPVTGKHLSPDFIGDEFLFPRNVQKITYKIRNTSYRGLAVEYKGETKIGDLNTYEFAYEGEMENAPAYPDTKLEAGQGIKCQHLELRYWVEPVTGEVVKLRERCSGDVVYDTASGNVIADLSRWSGETAGDDTIRRVDAIRSELNNYNLVSTYIPLALLIGGVICLVVGLVLTQRKPTGAN